MATTSFAVLPKDVVQPTPSSSSSTSRRFLRLPHPKTGLPAMYLPYQRSSDGKEGILEVQNVAPEEERSWFVGEEVVSDGKLLVLTPIDPIFLLLPVLEATTSSPPRFLLSDHIFSTAASSPAYALPAPFTNLATDVKGKGKGQEAEEAIVGVEGDDVLLLGQLKGVERLMRRVCDVQEINEDLHAYRLSPTLLTSYLRKKVARLAKKETFERFPALTRGLAKDGLAELTAEGNVDAETDATRKRDEEMELLRAEARISHALSLLRPYLSPSHYTLLLASYLPSTTASEPFPLYAAHLKSLVQSLAPASNPTPLTGAGSNGGSGTKPGVKRKVSQGMAKLAKADTTGMKRMDSFFKKKVKVEEPEKKA